MSSSKRRPISGDDEPVARSIVLPDDLVSDILTRLPGKQIGRCRCVCKPWRSIIRSRPFLETYRKRNRGLLIYWVDNSNIDGGVCTRRFNFSYCPLRRRGESPEELIPLSEMELRQYLSLECSTALERFRSYRPQNGMTQLVEGLVCVGEQVECGSSFSFRLSLHNVCTREMMQLPNPLPDATSSTYHLGYDPANRVYKLLRLIFRDRRAHILTLNPPSGSQSKWRELDCSSFDLYRDRVVGIMEVTACPEEGMVWWLCKYSNRGSESGVVALPGCLLCFDFSMEMFRLVEAPRDYRFGGYLIFQAITQFKDSLAVWLPSDNLERNVICCYVLEDDEGKTWSKQRLEISEDFKENGYFVLPSGNLVGSSSTGSMLVMDRTSSRGKPLRVYSCSARETPHDAYNEDWFCVGKIPYSSERGSNIYFEDPHHQWRCLQDGFGRVSCLLDGNNLHLPLDDILGGDSATM